MAFQKINSYTWVQDGGKKTLDEVKKLIDERSLAKSDDYIEKKKKAPENQLRNYRKFCSKVFEDRKFISAPEFNKLITQHFNQNSTYYRTRMLQLKLIIAKNKVIYRNDQKSETQ